MAEPIGYKFVIPPSGDSYRPKIERVPCISETKGYAVLKFIRFNRPYDNRIRKAGRVFDTWAEARAELLRRAEARLEPARRELQLAQAYHGNVVGMKEPTDA